MTNSSSSNSKKSSVPEARAALDQFKFEVANEIGVPLKQGYNGDLTSAQNGYVGGYMVNNMIPEQRKSFDRNLRSVDGHSFSVVYDFTIAM